MIWGLLLAVVLWLGVAWWASARDRRLHPDAVTKLADAYRRLGASIEQLGAAFAELTPIMLKAMRSFEKLAEALTRER